MMLKYLYQSRCWIAFAMICLLAACNVKSDMDNMERLVMEIETKFNRGEDISQDTSIFQARRYYDLSDDTEMKTLSALYSGCVYWQQSNYDSAMAALDEAIVLAKASHDEQLIEKVQQTIAELHSDLDRSEDMMKGFLRRRRMLIIASIALVLAAIIVGWLLVRASQKKRKLAEMNLSLEALQRECETLTETHRDNLFQRCMMIYKVFLVGEKKDIDTATFNKVKANLCGHDAATAYDAIFEAYHHVYPDVIQRLHNHQPALTESEFKVCILSMMPFSVKEVADILKVSPALVGKCRTGIRKKLGITEARGSIEKRLLIIAVLLCLFGGIHAQTTKVHGNLGMQNVHIIVTETKQGTISDAKGDYTLLLSNTNKRIRLLYSCIGYQDTVVSLTPEQLQAESVNVSFKMRPKEYTLEEVTVKENKPEIAYHEKLISLVAYEINEMGLYMIVYRKNSNALLHLTLDMDTLSILPIDRKFERLYKDVFGQIHLISYDSTYQIGHRQLGDTYLDAELFYGMTQRDFYRIMGNTAAATDSIFVIATYGDGAQELYYHYFKKGDPNAYLLEYAFDQEGLDLVESIRKFGPGGLIPPPPIYDPVFAVGDSLVLFNFEADKIEFFDKNAQIIGETPITFHRDVKWDGKRPLKKTWNRMILMDRVRKQFYAVFLEDSILVLKKINLITGEVKEVARLSKFQFVLLPKVNDGLLYFMFHTGDTHSKALYRMEIE